MNQTVVIQVRNLSIHLERKRIKNMNLVVRADRVRISAPQSISEEKIKNFILSKFDWIGKQQMKLQDRIRELPRPLAQNEVHYFMGKPYRLEIVEKAGPAKVKICGEVMKLSLKPDTSETRKSAVVQKWYGEEMGLTIPKMIEKWEPIMGVTVREWSIRKMKSRWGTCNVKSKKILLNLELAKKSPEYIEYVLVHEMTHLLEASHNERFKGFMTKFLPNWRVLKEELNHSILLNPPTRAE